MSDSSDEREGDPDAKSRLARSLANAVEQSVDAVLITDAQGRIEYVNRAFERLTGYRREEAIGKRHALSSGHHDGRLNRRLWETLGRGRPFRGVFVNRRKDGVLIREERTISPVHDRDGKISHFMAIGRDVGEQLRMRERLSFMTSHDSLTRLPNRGTFLQYLDAALTGARRRDTELAVITIDVDRFKTINDGLGHDVGDRLLGALAGRLEGCTRDGDTLARLGGDEFAILVEDFTDEAQLEELVRNVMQSLSRPFELDGREVFLTTSVGISLYPRDGLDAGSLLKSADLAMYAAKYDGRNNYQFFSPDQAGGALHRLDLELGLRRALERNEFELLYQPQVRIADQQLCGVEALVRWRHPELGLLTPADFITLLEETGLILPVGDWILQTAHRQQLAWRRLGLAPIRMAVNLSARQLSEPDFAERVIKILEADGEPVDLELEVTESVLMQSTSRTARELRLLNERGITVALDDFGTGYSSLAHIKQLPVDSIKIDRLFVRDVTTNPDDAAIIRAVLALSHSLGLVVVAEGIETEEHLAFLRDAGCAIGQGYLFGRPMPASDLELMLRAQSGK